MARIALLLLLLVSAACSGGVDTADAPSAASPVEDHAEVRSDPDRDAGDHQGHDEAAVDGEGLGEGEPIGDLPEIPAGDKVIKEGTITVGVEAGTFDAAFAKVVRIAADLQGNVVASTTETSDGGATSGEVTVRVPVERYEQLLVGVADIGEIRSRDITAQDVTAEYTDLEARLRHLQAQERFYLELLEEAASIADAVRLRQELDGLQSEVEQVKGRLQLLDSRTAYSVLTVALFEPGAPAGGATHPDTRPSLAQWWASARDALVNVVGVMLVVAFFLAPLALPGALLWGLWQTVRRRAAAAEAGM